MHNLAPAVTGKPGFLFVMMGINDINVSNSSAAAIENLLSQYYTFAQADGWTVVAETIEVVTKLADQHSSRANY